MRCGAIYRIAALLLGTTPSRSWLGSKPNLAVKELVLVIAALLVGLAACSTHQTVSCRVIPVPPADSRSDRMPLPLDPDAGAKLSRSLTYGLNKNNEVDDVGANANAAAQYRGLLDLLSLPHHPTLQDLSSPAFQKWFPGVVVQQVVDARDAYTPAQEHGPVAANDGAYWWIFYRDRDQLTGVMVTKVNACENLTEAKR
jgi:hypothetical protein